MAVLYRKYRPQTFGEVVNQKFIIQTLKNQVLSGQPAHAYLFTGSRGVGKTSIARILAKAVNCLHSKAGEPDGKCANCKAIADGSFLDLVEIDAASNTGVDNIRDLIEHVKFSPTVGKYKVFIIDEVHMLSKGAFNALLKTLEEPPKHAIFILATTEINKVPATIISRTQRFDFKRLSQEDLEEHLAGIVKAEKIKVPKEIISLVARSAEGSGRDALSLLDKVLTLGDGMSMADAQSLLGTTDVALSEKLFGFIAEGRAAEVPGFVESLVEQGTDLTVFNRDFLEYLRQALVYRVSEGKFDLGLEQSHQATLAGIAGKLSVADIIFTVRLFLRSFKEIGSSPSPDVPVLLAAIEAASRKSQPSQPARPPVQPVAAAPVREEVRPTPPPQAREEKKAPFAPVEAPAEEEVGEPLEIGEVREVWDRVVEAIMAINGPLAHLIKNSPVQAVRGGEIILGVKYLFHQQNLESKKNQEIIRTVIEKICGKKARVTAAIMKEEKQDPAAAAEAITDALKIFGGELVE